MDSMDLMIAEMMNVKQVERRENVTAAARDVNIVIHSTPDTRPSSSVSHTYTVSLHNIDPYLSQFQKSTQAINYTV